MTTNESNPAIVLTGGCQCGAVRYTARPESYDAYFCHCTMCRRAFGNVFATFFHLPKSAITWQGEPTYYASSKIARRGFCSRCGTPISFEYTEPADMDLSIGSLDEPQKMKPAMHVGVETRLPAFAHDDGLPERRVDSFENIVKMWKAAYGQDAELGRAT